MAPLVRYNTAPWLGKGLGFPVRIDPSTGGLAMTEGTMDPTAGLEFVGEQYTIREGVGDLSNKLREAMMNIVMTTPGEHETLPEYGGRPFHLINLPNQELTEQAWETYCEEAVRRWEHRIELRAPDDFDWLTTAQDVDHNAAVVIMRPRIADSQPEGNLVAPFVTEREARAAEYPMGEADAAGHDWTSRYRNSQVYQEGQVRWIRPRQFPPLPPRRDDVFHRVRHNDTWRLISWDLYGDTRFWWAIAEFYVQDAAERGEPPTAMDVTVDPEPGTLLRCPSRARLLMEICR